MVADTSKSLKISLFYTAGGVGDTSQKVELIEIANRAPHGREE